jgi:N-methylhydantoinase A/oxoprolinase/acetone carboxylase beta subunit
MIIGLDVGGTHTDVVLIGANGVVRDVKVPTDQSNLFGTVLTGLKRVTNDIAPESITRAVFSTTLTTNAVVQKKFPPVGIIVTSGPGIDPEFFRTGDHFYPVTGAMDHRGREIEPVDLDEIQQIAQKLSSEGVRYVGVVGKFSVRNSIHELAIEKALDGKFEKIFLSHEISGHLNFPRRIATTYLNAAVYPIHKDFFSAVQKSLEDRGFQFPIRILKPDGGTMNFAASIDYPGHTMLSGPAASVMGAISHAASDSESLVLDIGGTTTDMAILINGVPLLNPVGIELAGFKTLIRAMHTRSIGLGGDSLVAIKDGKLTIGPERLGPAIAFGGSNPTPTDALAILGKLPGGNRDASTIGIKPIAKALNLTVEDAAHHIFDDACKTILSAAKEMIDQINSKPVYTVHELLEGYKVKPKEILVLGGPAQFFSEQLKTHTDMNVRVVPHCKVANAIGAAMARTTCEVTLFADTQLGRASAPEESFSETIDKRFDKQKAVEMALKLLKKKALQMGAIENNIEMEVIENLQFNMVRGFFTTGKNIRVKVQVKPGLIKGDDLYSDR